MTHYLLSVHHDYDNFTPPPAEEMQAVFDAVDTFNAEVQESGAWVFAGGLVPPAEARVVDGTGEAVVTTDGPFAESKEHIGGFWIIEADDLDAALSWAERASVACANPVEVQPFGAFSDVAPTADGKAEFLLSVHMVEGQPMPERTEEEMQASWAAMQALEADMQSSGTWMYSARLGGPDTATVVRADSGDAVLTDGPFAESKEHMAGFYLIGADDRDAAIDWAGRVSDCVGRPIEVRPFQAG